MPDCSESYILHFASQTATAHSASDDILAGTMSSQAITPKLGHLSGRLRVSAAFSGSGVLSRVTMVGVSSVETMLNSGSALTANAEYEFEFDIAAGATYDFKYSASCNILKFVVKEI